MATLNGKVIKCPCGKTATYMCACGCPCCGDDPCIFNCGGGIGPIEKQLAKGILPKAEDKVQEDEMKLQVERENEEYERRLLNGGE